MLVQSRRKGQTFVINEEITITVVDIEGGRVKIGLDFPKEMTFRRGEVPPIEEYPVEEPPK